MTAAPPTWERGRAPRAHVGALTAASGSRGFITACLALVVATSRRSERGRHEKSGRWVGAGHRRLADCAGVAWRAPPLEQFASAPLTSRETTTGRTCRRRSSQGCARLASRSPPRRRSKTSPPATLARLPPIKGLPRPTRPQTLAADEQRQRQRQIETAAALRRNLHCPAGDSTRGSPLAWTNTSSGRRAKRGEMPAAPLKSGRKFVADRDDRLGRLASASRESALTPAICAKRKPRGLSQRFRSCGATAAAISSSCRASCPSGHR